ncbi:uncharacterized protein LOC6541105 [Drosophila erecta]|uniref:Uncharacterized protein n=1 Tax=Drosophila erecta TaxID=7220 RepID=B3N5R3_DROER|nr:uncharacterized protein LOC6541105 [Drosophila erecta]EDV58022.1 uncharacterized protein Dere_GG24212 [Drosophila erecta]
MSRIIGREEISRDRGLAQDLRREITRSSAEISFNFWQEFEHIRSTQRNRMTQERLQRERITGLIRDGQEEASQEAEALSRSISAHGITSTTLPAPLSAVPTASMVKSSLIQGVKSLANRSSSGVKWKPPKQKFHAPKSNKPKQKNESKEEPTLPSPAPSHIPSAPPPSRATMVTPNISNRVTPNISKYRLSNKPKK